MAMQSRFEQAALEKENGKLEGVKALAGPHVDVCILKIHYSRANPITQSAS